MVGALQVIRNIFTLFKWLKQSITFSKRKSKNCIYLTIEEIIQINARATGIQGQLRDRAGLESATMRPLMASYYDDADIVTQAAYLVDGICMAHAFNDGNKRTALIACITFLEINQCKLKGARGQISKEIESLVIKRDLEHFTKWLRKRIQIL